MYYTVCSNQIQLKIIIMYLLQGEVPGNNHLVKAVVDRREEADRSRSLERDATGPGGSEKQGQ